MPINLLLLRKSCNSVQRQERASSTPISMPGSKTLAYASGVFASEAVVRTWAISFPWLDRRDFYHSAETPRARSGSGRTK